MADPGTMSDDEIRRELQDIERQMDRVEVKTEEIGPVWLHDAMTAKEAEDLLDMKRAGILVFMEGLDEHSMIPTTLFLIEGPHYQSKNEDEDMPPPTGSRWYNIHLMWDEVPANQEAPTDTHFETHRAEWTLVYEDDEIIASGYNYDDTVYPDMRVLGTKVFGDRRKYTPKENAERLKAILELKYLIDTLILRKMALTQEIGGEIDVLLIKGDADLTISHRERVAMPRQIAGEDVHEYFGSMDIRAPERALILLWDRDIYQSVLPDLPYSDFKHMVAHSERNPPLVQVIEFDRKRLREEVAEREREEEHDRVRKRPRPDLTGAEAIYELGPSINTDRTRILTVYKLADNAGFVVVDDAINELFCDHVHTGTARTLMVEQDNTGKPCPVCASL